MTGSHDVERIKEALAVIDRGLGQMRHRELVSTDEVSDLLLDVRMLLTTSDLGEPETVGAGSFN
jgi:hypothetical protein